MLKIFNAFILTLTVIFIFSCNQNTEVKGDNPKEKIATKEEVTNINSDCPKCRWAIKKDPDGTITKMMRVNYYDEEDYYIKPDGFEWKKVLEKNPLKEPTGFETTAVEGPNIIKAKEGKEIKFFMVMHEEDEDELDFGDFENLDSRRVHAIRDIYQYVKADEENLNKSFEEIMNNSFEAIIMNRELKGHHVLIKIWSSTTESSTTESSTTESSTTDERLLEIYKNDSTFTDNTKLLIQIDNDKLDLHVRMHEPSETENKGFSIEESITTKINGDTYPTTNDFFKKLSDLGVFTERWNLHNASIPFGYTFYCCLLGETKNSF